MRYQAYDSLLAWMVCITQHLYTSGQRRTTTTVDEVEV